MSFTQLVGQVSANYDQEITSLSTEPIPQLISITQKRANTVVKTKSLDDTLATFLQALEQYQKELTISYGKNHTSLGYCFVKPKSATTREDSGRV